MKIYIECDIPNGEKPIYNDGLPVLTDEAIASIEELVEVSLGIEYYGPELWFVTESIDMLANKCSGYVEFSACIEWDHDEIITALMSNNILVVKIKEND